ncbi:hypothetical protein BU14_0265s0009 [Porphyra umbilicalis]|uniref:Uncharacterized protein n=1 Tax=Porphyra umbilicalis TaxID=2786 RepID=A0A1X6P2H0_PORUM|nr:hypothetical protein BU14_0265s0009 [Porphyra umbilicalis]|eukprot:OSX74843.1 hypothetical protein BU14_0265s0009 [Porphyra umbilicalis]
MQVSVRGTAAGQADAAASAAVAAAAAAAPASGRDAPRSLPTRRDASSASSAPSSPRSGSPFSMAAGSAAHTPLRLMLERNNPFYSTSAAASRLERTRAMNLKAANRAAA